MTLATSMDAILQKMIAEIDNISDTPTKVLLKKAVEDTLLNITVGVIFPIEKKFPHLNPDM